MAIETKEIIMYLRKGVIFSIRISYRSACAHPYISGMLFFLLILYRAFPSLFAFLISSSPVIVCTAVLLGTLLSYGTPNIPEIEEEERKTQEISSLQRGRVLDDFVTNKDESYTVETHLEADMEVNEKAIEDAVGETSKFDVSSAKIHDEGNQTDNTVSTTSLLLQEDKKEIHSELKMMEETEVLDSGSVEKREFSIEKQAEFAQKLDEDVCNTSANDQIELEGLTVQIAKTASESPFDSSLGSPWEPVNTCDAYSDSDSDSDGAESSSPDASMADIIPMLYELHPLLDADQPQPTLRATDDSDAASSELSQDHESDDGITEDEVENKEEVDKESQAKSDTSEAAVSWTADDQKNVMDLGYSEVERNRRLENLIAKRRLRKLQRFETERNLIDLDIYYPTPIPPISAPRRNPFDLPYDSYGNLDLPPIPGSAPSVLQPRQNPFDLPYDKVEELSTLSREYFSHHDFVSDAQREMLSRRDESSAVGPSFSGDFNQERTTPEETGFTAFGSQFSPKSDPKVSSVVESDISPVTGQEHHKELSEAEMNLEGILLSPISHNVEKVEQDGQSFGAEHSVDNKHEQSRLDVDTGHAIDFNTSTNIEGTHQATNAFGVMEEEIGETGENLCVSDTGKLEVIEEMYEDSNASSSVEATELFAGVNIHEDSANLEQKRNETMQSDWVDGAQYDSFPSTTGKALPNFSTADEAVVYEGRENFISNASSSDLHADFSEMASTPRPFEAIISLGNQDTVVVRSQGEDLASGTGEPLVESSDLYIVDENESRLRETTEIREHDAVKVGISETSGDLHPLVPVMTEPADGKIMHPSSLSSGDLESREDHLVDVNKSVQSKGNDMINEPPLVDDSVVCPPPLAGAQESQISILNLPSIPEENLEDFNLEDHKIVISPPASSGLTASQVVEESNAHMFDIEQEPSTRPKATEIDNDLAIGLVSEGKNGDVSDGSLMIPTDDGSFPGSSHVLELTESTEFSTLPEMKSEHEMGSGANLSDSQTKITDEILSKQDEEFLKNLNNSDKELDDEVHAEVSGIKDIDEGLLSELDAVGDFRVESKLKLDQGGPNLEQGQLDSVLEGSFTGMRDTPYQLQYSREMKDADMLVEVASEAKFNPSDKVNPVTDQPKSVKPEVGFSLLPSGEDPEMTLYNSKLHVLEACSIEELDSVFKQYHEEDVVPLASDLNVENSVISKSEKGGREMGIANKKQELAGTDSELLVLEAKSVEDISSALKQHSEGLNKPNISEVEMSEVLPVTHLEPDETYSDLHVVEAKSLEDISLAFKQISKATVASCPEQMKHEDGRTEDEVDERHLEPEVGIQSLEASEKHPEPEPIEEQSAEEIKLDPVESAARETNMLVEQSSEKSDGIAVEGDVSRSRYSTSRKIQKKKSHDSGSDSSSSSSASD